MSAAWQTIFEIVCLLHGNAEKTGTAMLYILKLVCLLQKYEKTGMLYVLKLELCNSGENGTAVHSKTSMLLVEITCMSYHGNRDLKVPESYS